MGPRHSGCSAGTPRTRTPRTVTSSPGTRACTGATPARRGRGAAAGGARRRAPPPPPPRGAGPLARGDGGVPRGAPRPPGAGRDRGRTDQRGPATAGQPEGGPVHVVEVVVAHQDQIHPAQLLAAPH